MATIIEHEPPYRIGYIVGSIASTSINRQLSRALVRLAPEELVLEEIPIVDLPFYSSDHDADYPEVARTFKAAIRDVDAVLVITPEYNRSIPGVLKNAIDWASRPYGENAFAHKATAIIGASPGSIGTAVGQQHLRSILAFCNSPLMSGPEAYITLTPGLVDDDGNVTDESTAGFLRAWMGEVSAHVQRVLTVVPKI